MELIAAVVGVLLTIKLLGITQSIRWLRTYQPTAIPFPVNDNNRHYVALRPSDEILASYRRFTSEARADFFPFGLKRIKARGALSSRSGTRLIQTRQLLFACLKLRWITAASLVVTIVSSSFATQWPLTLAPARVGSWIILSDAFLLAICVPAVAIESMLSFVKTRGYASTLHMRVPPPANPQESVLAEIETLIGTAFVALVAAVQGALVLPTISRHQKLSVDQNFQAVVDRLPDRIADALYRGVSSLTSGSVGPPARTAYAKTFVTLCDLDGVALLAMTGMLAVWASRVGRSSIRRH